ncbi:NuoE NADH,ubiquinone oxidoreductase 24 kD subunit [Fimbriimonadaceae bacterium]
MSELLKLGAPNERPRAPKPGEVELNFTEQGVAELEALVSHYPNKKACILPALWLAQREYGGYLNGPAIAEVAFRLGRAYAEVEGVATFYTLYNTAHQPGRHKLELCTCLSCMVNGAFDLRDYIREKLGVGHGETTADGEFTFEEVECLNACDRAVVMQVGDEYYGPLDKAGIDALLEKLRTAPENTVIKYANAVVRVQLRKDEAPTA